MKFLSIIIPVYKVEKYVGATLQSIIDQRQDLFDYEVIVVDDGTPDKSMEVVESFSQQLPQMTIIHQENKGLSGARNTGFNASVGKYVWFVDSDDILAPKAFEILWGILQQTDAEIYTFSLQAFHDGEKELHAMRTIYAKNPPSYYGRVFTGFQLHNIIGSGIAPKIVFAHSFLAENQLLFLEKIYHEDMEFLARAFFFTKRMYVSDKVLYIYRLRNSGSIMAERNEKHLGSIIQIMDSFEGFKKKYAKTAEEKSFMDSHIFALAISLFCLNDSVVQGYSSFMHRHENKIRRRGIRAGFSALRFLTIGQFAKLWFLIFIPFLLRKLWVKKRR